MSSRTDWQFFAGEDFTIPDTIYQSDGVTPQDITGWTVQFVMYDFNGAVALTKSGSAVALTNPTAGLVTVTVAAADTAGWQPKNYQWRIERADAGAESVLSYGLATAMHR